MWIRKLILIDVIWSNQFLRHFDYVYATGPRPFVSPVLSFLPCDCWILQTWDTKRQCVTDPAELIVQTAGTNVLSIREIIICSHLATRTGHGSMITSAILQLMDHDPLYLIWDTATKPWFIWFNCTSKASDIIYARCMQFNITKTMACAST